MQVHKPAWLPVGPFPSVALLFSPLLQFEAVGIPVIHILRALLLTSHD
jgi:hypothetical protein